MSERPRKAASPVPPVEDPPRDTADQEAQDADGGSGGSNRSGRRVRIHGRSGPKDTVTENEPEAVPTTFDAEGVTQAWDKFREADEIVKLLVNRANGINADVDAVWNASRFDKIVVREEILRFDDVRDNQTRLSLDAVEQAAGVFYRVPNKENAQAYAQAVKDFATKVQLLEASAKDFIAATERAPQAADALPEAGTAREERTKLRKAVEEMRFVEEAKANAEAAQKQYFEALKERFNKQGGIETISNQFINTSNSGSKDLKQLREQWIQTRAEFAGAQWTSAEARLWADPSAARNRLLERLRQKHAAQPEKADLLLRYERIVTARSVVIGFEEEEQKIKEEGLSERDKGTFDAMLGWYKNLPPGVRVMGTSALMFGAGAVIAGTPAGWAALGLGGSAALLRWAAEAQKGPKTKATFGFLSRIASVGGVAGFLTEAAVTGTHSVLGTVEKAEAKLNAREGLGNLSDPKNLARISKERRKATGVEESIKRQGRLARMVGSLTGGWLFGNAMGGNTDDVETIAGTTDAPAAVREDVVEAAAPAPAAEVARDVVQPAAPAENAPPAAVVPEAVQSVEPIVATIEAGEGFNKLFLDLRDSVDERLHGMQDTSSPLMKYLFEASPTELSDRIGAFDPKTGESMIMQVGDKLYLDDKGDLYFQRAGEEAQLVMENDSSAPDGYVVHELKDVEMRAANPVVQAPVNESVSESAKSELQESLAGSPVESETTSEVPYAAVSSVPSENVEEPSISQSPTVPGSEPELQNVGDTIPRASLGTQNQGVGEQIPSGMLKTESLESWAQASVEAETQEFSNVHGVEINPSEPAGYEWKAPGTNVTFTVAFGEDAAATERWALRELELHPESRVLINYTDTNPSTGAIETSLGAWQIGEDGKPEFMREVANPENGLRFSAANPQDFIRKLP